MHTNAAGAAAGGDRESRPRIELITRVEKDFGRWDRIWSLKEHRAALGRNRGNDHHEGHEDHEDYEDYEGKKLEKGFNRRERRGRILNHEWTPMHTNAAGAAAGGDRESRPRIELITRVEKDFGRWDRIWSLKDHRAALGRNRGNDHHEGHEDHEDYEGKKLEKD